MGQESRAFDAVERVARRTPALFRTNQVPSITMRSIDFEDLHPGGAI